ncbi:3TM-type holin [Aliivibrio kagoshimensis]|uniref:3TM-type holin n=1 Tax=Aliivibrio kagoshimensis TaxID=2910230 RepID=UPI003D10978B
MWESIKSLIGSAAPLIGTLIGGPVGAGVGGLVANALGVENTPQAIEQELMNNPDALLALKSLEMEHQVELKQLALEHAKLESEERKLALTQQHATMQAELASNDPYVRRWRPTWGYSMCAAWVMLFLGVAFVMVFHPKEAANVMNSVVAMTPLFGIGLAVLGINIHKRSQDKQVSLGVKPLGAINALKQTLKGG